MPNTYVNKVTLSNGTTLIDLTSDTVTSAAHIVSGHTGHLADGTQVAGTATTAPDIPVFTVVWDDGWESVVSITCNKTFGDCYYGYLEDGIETATTNESNQSQTENYDGLHTFLIQSGSSSVKYLVMRGVIPAYDITYNSDGTTSVTNPSSRYEILNATANGTYYPQLGMIGEVNVNVPATTPSLQSKTATPSETAQTITADSGYDGLSSVQINAMPTGTAGTPTATKGTVSNHSVSVTPSVTNAAGYIQGGTKTGTAVTVSASELVSGSETKTANGTYDVTNLASIVIDVPSSGGSTLGTKTITANGTYAAEDDGYDGYSEVTVNVPTGGSSGIKIGIETTPIPNILNMFYALENGTAKTGEFTLAQSIPNSSTLIFSTGLSTVHGIFIADESMSTLQTSNTPENTLWAIIFNPTSNTGSYAMTRITNNMTYGTNQNGVSRGFLNRVSAWEVTDGKLYATGQYNRNSNYTPFYPGRTYRWVAW